MPETFPGHGDPSDQTFLGQDTVRYHVGIRAIEDLNALDHDSGGIDHDE